MAKTKLKRVGSFLCFSAPFTDENGKSTEKRERSVKKLKDSTEIDGSRRKSDRRVASKILRSSSINSNSSDGSVKSSRDPSRSLSSSRRTSRELSNELFGKDSEASIFSPSLSSSSSSSSSRFSHAADSVSTPEVKTKPEKTFVPSSTAKNNGYAMGLFLVLVSLSVMVFCGRLTAILWTATWLCLVPRRRVLAKLPEFDDVAAERKPKRGYEEEEKKKRVVLEGFLQRNRKGVN